MAEYDNAGPGAVIVKDHGDYDRNLGLLIASGHDAGRDVADAGRDLISAVADAGRDIDIISAIREEGGDGRAATLSSQAHVTDALNRVAQQNMENILREGAAGRETTNRTAKENVEHLLDQGARGRETTLAAKTELLVAAKDTQFLVAEKACEIKEVVRDEGSRTRDVVVAEARAILERELTVIREENTLLKLQINVLSSGPGPLLK